MRIPERTLSDIQSRLDLAEVIGEYVSLQKRGSRYWGRCPFHQEKTPSFCVTPEKGVFYCFGCHKGGGVFQFVMEVEKIPFLDAVELLARKAGVEIQREEAEEGGVKRETYLELNRRLAGSFHWFLMENPQAGGARAYLKGRGVTEETVKSFQLGYAPADREWLRRFLLQKNYSEDFLVRTGLFSESSHGKSALFANRIVFPIANARGEIIAFGGRALVEGVPKYLNSPETAFFRKGENLFGIDKALAAFKDSGTAVLVEGYMDVLAMHHAGIVNCVAPLGTSLTEQQVRLLKRYVPRVALAFDGDEAGEKATLKAVEMLEREDEAIRVLELPAGLDPADIVLRDGPAAMKERLEGARECFPFLVEKALRRHDCSTAEGKEKILDFLFPFLAVLGSQVKADDYIRRLADAIGANETAVRTDFSRWREGRRMPAATREAAGAQKTVSAELFLMLAIATRQELFPMVRRGGITIADFEDTRARELFVALEESFRAEETSFDALLERIEDKSLRQTLMGKVASGEFDMNQERMVAESVRRIKLRALSRRRDMLPAEIGRLEQEKTDPSRLKELLAEKMHLDDEFAKLDAKGSLGDRISDRGQDAGL